ncbi:MAG: hypothetical protein LAN70_11065 [Acidobacteriia bacterium]|nr:hypothetical protein [Terriglobia bacterium]
MKDLVEVALFAVLLIGGTIVWATLRMTKRLDRLQDALEIRLHAVYMKLDHPDKHFSVVVDTETGSLSVEED